ncbi:hypothetical protein ACI68E_000142 [Malassezia pachydermatis]
MQPEQPYGGGRDPVSRDVPAQSSPFRTKEAYKNQPLPQSNSRHAQATSMNAATSLETNTNTASKRDSILTDGALGMPTPSTNGASALSRTATRSLNPADTLQPWEKEVIQLPEVQRKATLAQICMFRN